MNIIPLFTSIIALIFTTLLLRQFIQKKKIHQLLWTIAFLLYGISTLMEFLMNPEFFGVNFVLFCIYYLFGTSLVGFLGAGELYLLIKRIIPHIFILLVLTFMILLTISLIITPLPVIYYIVPPEFGASLRDISNSYPLSVRIYAILLASIGGVVLISGLIISLLKDRCRYYNVLFILGALMPMFRNVPFGYLGNELAGIIFFFSGFLLSVYLAKKRTSKAEKPESKI
ncbi:MAG: hypothetical protein ACFFDN_50010 [Candidatus Hodarchaeota archaeon]